MTWNIWLIIAIVLVIFEIVTPSIFFFVCLSIGSIFATVAAYFNFSGWIEFSVFIVVSVLSLYFIRPIFKKVINKFKTVNSNIDALIGTEAVVTEEITPFKIGFVKVSSEIWRASSDVKLEVSEVVRIKNVSGTTLIVSKVK
ncbi:MAG: NfeD family protein [Endomicrobium sp.]|nr:NfeD family protein [Endomicrobium sp.]